jgi:rhodanese-related sulfurtransferase
LTKTILQTGLNLVENINSKEAFDLLKEDENAVLIDVRTNKEHMEVGIPDLREIGKDTFKIEWRNSILPGSRKRFLYDFNKNLSHHDGAKYLFICRSGIRSKFAALTVEESFKSGNYNGMCFNIEDGFEGFEQPSVYPSNPTGWKNLGLPWSRVD